MKRSFLIAFCVIFLFFSILGIFYPDSGYLSVLKVFGVFLCFVYSFILWFRKDKCLVVALFLTFVADVILAGNNLSTIGVALFALAQFFHLMRLSSWGRKFWMGYFIAIVIIFLVGITEEAEPIFIAGSIYAVSLVSNFVLVREWFKSEGTAEAKSAYIGFSLFLICDFNVLLSFFSLTGVIFAGIYRIANYLAWEFYFPSQILISKSGKV